MRAVHRLQYVHPLGPQSAPRGRRLGDWGVPRTPGPVKGASAPGLRALTRFLRALPVPAAFLRADASLLLPGRGPGWQHMPCGTARAFTL